MALMRPLSEIRGQMERIFNEMETLHFPALDELRSLELRPLRERLARAWYPAIDLSELQGNYLLKVEVPGVKPEDLQLEVQEDTVIVQGTSKEEKIEERKGLYHRECSSGSLYRRIALPGTVKANQVSAELKNGILSITLPKLDEKKGTPVKIQVK